MSKKYLPYITLLLAASLLFWVKKNQLGRNKYKPTINQNDRRNVHPSPAENQNRKEDFDRSYTHLTFTKHAKCRMSCRHIDENEVKEILQRGNVNPDNIETDARGKTFPVEGVTRDNQRVRIVFAPKPDGELVVVTCIDLDTEWSCDCK